MASAPINLVDFDIQRSNLFRHMPLFDRIHYEGHPDGKVQKFKALREDQECLLLSVNLIRKEEDFLWKAAEDLLTRSILDAAPSLQGIHTFDLLTFDIHNEVKTFKPLELTAVIMNASRKLQAGEQRLIRYSSCYAIVQKLVIERWGKMTMKTSVEVYNDKPAFIFSIIKRLFKLAPYSNLPLILLINDVSSQPLYDRESKEQNEMIAKIIKEQEKDSIEYIPEVFWQDKNGMRELATGMIIDNK